MKREDYNKIISEYVASIQKQREDRANQKQNIQTFVSATGGGDINNSLSMRETEVASKLDITF
jgi:hypothetical protein